MGKEQATKELARQLKNPEGKNGIEVAQMMSETNQNMIFHSIKQLDIQPKNKILEIGYANANHIDFIFKQNPTIVYYGLEISPLMCQQASNFWEKFSQKQNLSFGLYDGQRIPFKNLFFNKIFSVNTIYFWENPTEFLSEIYRVLQPNGLVCITFIEEEFLKKMPFSKYGFTFYDNQKVMQLARKVSFHIENKVSELEFVKSKKGQIFQRKFTTITLKK